LLTPFPLFLPSYIEAHSIIRNITGLGSPNGPYISIQGGTATQPPFTGSDRIALEQHLYFAFDNQGAEDITPYLTQPCDAWGTLMNSSRETFGVTTAAEWSLAFNDCECGLGYFFGVGH
jgi:glucan 1,3-beta-glucosidase